MYVCHILHSPAQPPSRPGTTDRVHLALLYPEPTKNPKSGSIGFVKVLVPGGKRRGNNYTVEILLIGRTRKVNVAMPICPSVWRFANTCFCLSVLSSVCDFIYVYIIYTIYLSIFSHLISLIISFYWSIKIDKLMYDIDMSYGLQMFCVYI